MWARSLLTIPGESSHRPFISIRGAGWPRPLVSTPSLPIPGNRRSQAGGSRPAVEDVYIAGAVENAEWPVTCDAAGSIAAGRSSQP